MPRFLSFTFMKKATRILLLAVCLCLTLFTAKSQSSFSLGIKAGANLSNFIKETDFEVGADAGIFIRAGKMFYFQPEVLYSFRSTTFDDIVNEADENIKANNHHIDIPLLLGFKIVNNENFNFRIFLGPRVGLRVGSDYSDIDSLIGYAQWGGRAGIGIDFWRFTLDFNYDISATKFKNADANTFWKQNIISVAIGFKIVK